MVAGNQHACAVRFDGTLWCWGDDGSQQLGNGNSDTTDRQTPIQVTSVS